jgi:hypothetical protein
MVLAALALAGSELVVAHCLIGGIHTMTLWTAKEILQACAGWKRQNEADDNPAKPDDARHPHRRPYPISPQVSVNVVGFEGVGVLGETDFPRANSHSAHPATSSSEVLASCRTGVPKPSVNQSQTGVSRSRASGRPL